MKHVFVPFCLCTVSILNKLCAVHILPWDISNVTFSNMVKSYITSFLQLHYLTKVQIEIDRFRLI